MTQDVADPLPRRADAGALLVALGLPSLITWLYFIALRSHSAAVQQAVYVAGKTVQFGLPLVWVLLVQRRPASFFVWPRRAGLAEGLGFGAVISVAMLLGYRFWLGPAGYLAAAVGPVQAKLAGFGVDGPAKYLALALFYSLVHALFEEYYWRWFVFGQLRRLLPLGAAILVSSFAFAAHHVIVLGAYFGWASPATWLFSACVAVGGAVWCWNYDRGGSLLSPWLSHLLIDAAIFAVGYQLVRGG